MLKSEINHKYEINIAKRDYICQNCPIIVLVSDQMFWSMLHSHEFQSQNMITFGLTDH